MNEKKLVKSIRKAYADKGYLFRDTINIAGFRDPSDQDKDVWNDYISLTLPQDGKVFLFSGTTDPGKYYTENPYAGTVGAMHLCLGQYLNAYQIGNHRGKPALCQWNAPVKIWRDVDKSFDFVKGVDVRDENSWNGTNIHYPGSNAEDVIRFSSAGCQVIRPDKDDYFAQWNYFFKLVSEAMEHYKIKYLDYTLFSMDDLPRRIEKNKEHILDLG